MTQAETKGEAEKEHRHYARNILKAWWERAHENEEWGDLAQLRRCQSVFDAHIDGAFHRACRDLSLERAKMPTTAIAVVALAHIKEDAAGRTLGSMLGQKTGTEEDSPRLFSETRFRRLLASTTDDLMDQAIRIVAQLEGEVPVENFLDIFLYWGDYAKRRLAFDYFGTSAAKQEQDAAANAEAAA